jgi:signal transduction histidine kinase
MDAPVKILLVEDNPGDARLVSQMLSETPEARFAFEHAETLKAALAGLGKARPDIVLLDLSLPDTSGLQTFVRFHAATPGLPVIVLTGLDDQETALEAVQQGAQDYLVKGQLDHRLLARSIRYAIERQYNIDELHSRARELAERENRLATIVTTTADGIVVIDRDGVVRFVNPAAETILGRPASALQGGILGYPITSEAATEIDLLPNADPPRTAEMRVVEVQWDGRPAYLAALRDITQHKETLKELEESRKQQLHMKDLFLSHVSHELRSPLAVIHQFVSILLDGIPGDINSEQREYLGIVARNVGQLVAMIDDLLLASRCREDKVTISCRRMSIRAVIRELMEMFQTSMSQKGLNLLIDAAEDLPSVYADPIRVKEVLTNLLDNASKFTPASGTVRITACVDPGNHEFMLVAVADTGCGMKADELAKVFRPLYQAGGGMDHSRTGLGLGLFICRELVTRQGGDIWVESQPGEGTTFSFTLPVFFLEKLIAPILTDQNLGAGVLALVSVSVVPRLGRGSLENVNSAARRAISSCILVDKDVMLPPMSDSDHHGVISIVACADREGAEILARRIRDQLARVEIFKDSQVEVAVSFQLLDISKLSRGKSTEDAVRAVAGMLAEVAAENTDREGEPIWTGKEF